MRISAPPALALAALSLPLLVAALAAESKAPAAEPKTPAARAAPHATSETRCAVCHVVDGWEKVKFDHSHTGFPLEGRHLQASCKECHLQSDFKTPLATNCTICHQDVHRGELGTRCAGCHDPSGWQSRYDADAHRRTNFPLVGRHAILSCEECHVDQRGRGFTRAAVECLTCHQAELARTAHTSVDHAANGFGTRCADCHGGWSFRGARFAAHDTCFELLHGSHRGIACLDCHTSLRNATVSGSCNTGTASCTRCHTCAQVERLHTQVAGYQCKDRKCYECHSFLAPPSAPPARRFR